MLKPILAALAAASMLGLAGCGQGPNEEAGEQADTAAEQAATGETNLGQGPMEEAGEQLDEAQQGEATTETATDPDTTPAPTTP